MRLAAANLLTVHELSSVLGVAYYMLVQIEAEELNGLMRGEPLRKQYNRSGLRQMGKNARICPACIAEDLPATAAMSAHLPIPCDRHNLMPIDECGRCKSTLSYKRHQIESCNCGFPLASSKQISPPNWLPDFFHKYFTGDTPAANDFGDDDRKNCHVAAKVVRALLSKPETTIPYAWISLTEFLSFESFVTDWPTTLRKFIYSLPKQEKNAYTSAIAVRINGLQNVILAKAAYSIWDEVRTDLGDSTRLVVRQNTSIATVSLGEASDILGTDVNFTLHLWWARWFHAAELEDDLWTPRFDPKHLTDTLNGLRNRCLPGRDSEPNLRQIWSEFRKKAVRPCAHLRTMASNPADWPLYSTVVNSKIDDMTSQVSRWTSLSNELSIADRLFYAAVK